MAVVTDKEFLEGHLAFALWQPAMFSAWLVNQMDETGGFNQTAALQVFINMELSLEALTMWYFALQEWRPHQRSLLKVYANVSLSERPSSKRSARRAIDEIAGTNDPEQLLERLNQPWPYQLLVRGWTHGDVMVRRKRVVNLVERLGEMLETRLAGNGSVLRAFNKTKHGLLVLRDPTDPNDLYPLSRIIADRGQGADVEYVGLSTRESDLRPLVRSTLEVCELTAALLGNLPWFYFTTQHWSDYLRLQDNVPTTIHLARQRILQLLAR